MRPRVSLFILPPFWLKVPALSGVYLKQYIESKRAGTVTIHDCNADCFRALDIPIREYLALDQNFEETLFERIRQSAPALLKRIVDVASQSDVIGFTVFSRNKPFVVKTFDLLQDRFPKKVFVFGGPEMLRMRSNNAAFLCRRNTYFVYGEGEIPLYRICGGERDQREYRYCEIEDLDSLPFIDFDDYDLSDYSKKMLPLLSSRGCTRRCSFCSESLLYERFRHHSPEYIVELIRSLIKRHGVTSFSFQDSLFNYSLPWLTSFCSLVLKENIKIQWEAQMRVDPRCTPELASLMKESGCMSIFIGMESASDRVLAHMRKGFTRSDACRFFEVLDQARLHFELSLMVGYPAEDDEDFKQTVDFIVKHRRLIPKIAQINPFVVYTPSIIAEDKKMKSRYDPAIGKKRIRAIIKQIRKYKIRHTLSFINNLVYTD